MYEFIRKIALKFLGRSRTVARHKKYDALYVAQNHFNCCEPLYIEQAILELGAAERCMRIG